MSRVNENLIELAVAEMKKRAAELGIFGEELKNYESIQLKTQVTGILQDLLKRSATVSPFVHAPRPTAPKERQAYVYAVWIRVDETLPWIEIKGTYETRREARKAAEGLLRNMLVKVVDLHVKGGIYDKGKLVNIVPQARKPNHDFES